MSPARALICVVALTACSSQRAKLATAGISVGVSGIATVQIATMDENPPVLLTALALSAGMLGMLALLSGLDHGGRGDVRPTVTIPQPDRRDEAWELTKLAASAARAGDCALVSVQNRIVRDIDPEFHEVVFVRDVAIARCLASEAKTSAS